MKRGVIILFTLLCLIASCAPVGPNYQRKDSAVPSRFGSLEKGVTTGEAVGNEFLGSWWKIGSTFAGWKARTLTNFS